MLSIVIVGPTETCDGPVITMLLASMLGLGKMVVSWTLNTSVTKLNNELLNKFIEKIKMHTGSRVINISTECNLEF